MTQAAQDRDTQRNSPSVVSDNTIERVEHAECGAVLIPLGEGASEGEPGTGCPGAVPSRLSPGLFGFDIASQAPEYQPAQVQRFSVEWVGIAAKQSGEREVDVLKLVARGNTNALIATALNISPETVKGYMSSILLKLQAKDRAHAVMIALERGILLSIPVSRSSKAVPPATHGRAGSS